MSTILGIINFIVFACLIFLVAKFLNKYIKNIFVSAIISVILTAVFGYFLLLAYIGIFIFKMSINKNTNEPKKEYRYSNEAQEYITDFKNTEMGILIALMAKVAKSDGRVSELEAELIKNTLNDMSALFPNSTEARDALKQIYNSEKEIFTNTTQIAFKYLQMTKNNYEKRVFLIEYLLNLAFIDGVYDKSEEQIIKTIADVLYIDKRDFANLLGKFQINYKKPTPTKKMNLDDAYDILEASRQDSFEIIKKKYRKLVRKYHPDILSGKGADKHTIEEATKKLQVINEAYEMIEKYCKD